MVTFFEVLSYDFVLNVIQFFLTQLSSVLAACFNSIIFSSVTNDLFMYLLFYFPLAPRIVILATFQSLLSPRSPFKCRHLNSLHTDLLHLKQSFLCGTLLSDSAGWIKSPALLFSGKTSFLLAIKYISVRWYELPSTSCFLFSFSIDSPVSHAYVHKPMTLYFPRCFTCLFQIQFAGNSLWEISVSFVHCQSLLHQVCLFSPVQECYTLAHPKDTHVLKNRKKCNQFLCVTDNQMMTLYITPFLFAKCFFHFRELKNSFSSFLLMSMFIINTVWELRYIQLHICLL